MVRPFSRRQQSTQVLLVRNVVWAHNQDIAEVDKYERQASQDTVHHELERGAIIAQAKGHP